MMSTKKCSIVDMDSEQIQRHVDLVRRLSKPGEALGLGAPNSTMRNPHWWSGEGPTPNRGALHQVLHAELRARAPGVRQERRALVLAGPPGAGKGGVSKPRFLERHLVATSALTQMTSRRSC